MIATSSPNSRISNAQANTIYNPQTNITGFRFSSGPFAGMTFQEAQAFINQRRQEVQQVTGQKSPQSNATQQILGMGTGLLGTAAIGSAIKGGGSGIGSAISGLFGGGAAATPAANAVLPSGGSLATSLGLGGTASGGAAAGGTSAGIGAGLTSLALPAAVAVGAGLAGKGLYDAAQGKDIPLYSQSTLAPLTGGLSLLYNPAKKLFGSKREGERMERKDARLGMQKAGLMGPESRSIYTLPDGTNFDIREFKKNTGQDAYNIDWSTQDGKRDERVGALNALTNAIIGGKNRRGESAMTGELYNALMSGGDFDQNTKAIFDKMGGRDAVYGAVANNWGAKGSKMTANERDAYFAAIDKLYGIKNTNNSRWDSQLTGDLAARNQKELQKAEALKPATPPTSQGGVNRSGGRQGVRRV